MPSPFITAPVDINVLSDGQTVRVNLVRFTGKIPSSNATILINNSPVTVDNSDYYIYLDLKKGPNIIEVKTIEGAETKTQDIHIFFEPPLAVHIYLPNFDPNVNYLKNPSIVVDGDVSNPLAEVEVNGTAQRVREDGTFTAKVLLSKGSNIVKTVAILENEVDTYTLMWLISDTGRKGVVPGYVSGYSNLTGSDYLTSLITRSQTIDIKAGESAILDFGISIGKATPNNEQTTIELTRITPISPASPNIKIDVLPSNYSVYPKIKYYSRILIETEPIITPGDYHYSITFSDSSCRTSFEFVISIY